MDHYGIILRQLRLLNKLSVKAAAARIERSTGWISEIENTIGSARIHPQEFERIVAAYGGERYRKQFGIWVAKAHKPPTFVKDISTGGAILKYLRKKAELTLEAVAKEVGFSACYLSAIETGSKALPAPLRDSLMRVYGYSPSSFKNFATEDKRAKNVPERYRIAVLLKQMDDRAVEKVLGFALSVAETAGASVPAVKGAV